VDYEGVTIFVGGVMKPGNHGAATCEKSKHRKRVIMIKLLLSMGKQ